MVEISYSTAVGLYITVYHFRYQGFQSPCSRNYPNNDGGVTFLIYLPAGAWWHRGCTYSHLNAMWTSAATTTRNYMLWIQTGTAPYNAVQRSTMRITRV